MSDDDAVARRGTRSSAAVRWALFLALGVIAVAYFVMPLRAEESCESWTAEVMEDEGGEVLTAAVCTREYPDAWLLLICHDGNAFLRFDLAYGAERSPDTGEVREVDFQGLGRGEGLTMTYQEMDGLFAGHMSADATFLDVFRGEGDLRVADRTSFYPEKTISLAGAAGALDAILAGC
jgi:hypothetical protein